jgi:sugar lactone lactonase YvrE
MNQAGKINKLNPSAAIPGGEIMLECEGFTLNYERDYGVYFNETEGRVVSASNKRVIAAVPDDIFDEKVKVHLESGGQKSNSLNLTLGKMMADDLHLVANPAFDPKDGSLILTRSGSRGQQLPVTLYRLETDGFLQEISGEVMNPTGIAFDPTGQMFVTSRAEGTVYRLNRTDEALPFATDLGVATGLAFDRRGQMYVGDRGGIIYKVNSLGDTTEWAKVEMSVAAYHLAFGLDGSLYVTAPSVASFDCVYKISEDGEVSTFYKGLGRPQGLAFDREGNLYTAACLHGRRGIVKITPDAKAELFVAGMNIVGLCFNTDGDLIAATNEKVYSLPLGIYGTLLQ